MATLKGRTWICPWWRLTLSKNPDNLRRLKRFVSILLEHLFTLFNKKDFGCVGLLNRIVQPQNNKKYLTHLLTLMLFQICIKVFVQWKRKFGYFYKISSFVFHKGKKVKEVNYDTVQWNLYLNENIVMNFSPSCHSKPVSLFIFGKQSESFLTIRKQLHCSRPRLGYTADFTWTILTMSSLPFWALNVVALRCKMWLHLHCKFSMQG